MFFNLRLAWDPKVIGVKNGVYQVKLDEGRYDKVTYAQLRSLFIGDLESSKGCPDVDFIFFFSKLKQAKETSFMSFTPYLNHCHFLADEDTLELLNTYRIQPHKEFESQIYDLDKKYSRRKYRLFCSALQDWDVIDFRKTTFVSGGIGKNPIVEHKFLNQHELRSFDGITKVRTLVLTNSFDSSLDFFHTRVGGLFVSEKLRVALEKANATGIRFTNAIEVIV